MLLRLLAGGGQVLGESDRQGAFPKSNKIDPVGIQATIYHSLGLNLQHPIYDQLHRPHAVTTGKVVRQLL